MVDTFSFWASAGGGKSHQGKVLCRYSRPSPDEIVNRRLEKQAPGKEGTMN